MKTKKRPNRFVERVLGNETVRGSRAYMIISGAHLGVDDQILATLQRVKAFYKAHPIHLGPTATPKEMKAMVRTAQRLKSLEDRMDAPELTEGRLAQLENQHSVAEQIEEGLRTEYKSRIAQLKMLAKDITFVATTTTSPQDWLNEFSNTADWTGHKNLSKYLVLSGVMPTGERSSTAKLNLAALRSLKQHGKNWIVPHPVPAVDSLPKPGLNESYNYWTTGALRFSAIPTQTSEQYRQVHEPAAIIVLVDKENGEFYAHHVHIDIEPETGEPMVLDDGMVFTPTKTFAVGSEDKGVASTDDHAPYQHNGTLACTRSLNANHRPSIFVNIGDAADFSSICHHVSHLPGELENKRLIADLIALKNLLTAQTADFPTIKRKILVDSNHHEWLTVYVKANPALIGLLDWPSIVDSPHGFVAGFEVMMRKSGESEIYSFGDYTLRHGDQENGALGAEKIYPKGKYLCGHWHRYLAYRRSIQMGCGCGLGPAYLQGRQTGWQSQIASLTKYKGVAAVQAKTVLHDKKEKRSRYCYQNSIIEVDSYVFPE